MRHVIFLGLLAVVASAPAADWPEWRGAGRQGIWTETDVVERFPPEGLRVKWKDARFRLGTPVQPLRRDEYSCSTMREPLEAGLPNECFA